MVVEMLTAALEVLTVTQDYQQWLLDVLTVVLEEYIEALEAKTVALEV